MQYANRNFDFPVVSTQPHLEVSNIFAVGVNRGNPDIYRENRFEVVDNVTRNWGNHTLSFGGNFNRVGTYESFPLFYPFEADFANLPAFLGTDGAAGCPVDVAVSRSVRDFLPALRAPRTPEFNETSILGGTAVYQGGAISQAVRNQSSATLNHYYTGFYGQDKWRATQAPHAKSGTALGIRELADRRVEYAVEEFRSARRRGLQSRALRATSFSAAASVFFTGRSHRPC